MEKFLQFIRKNRALLILIVSVVACAALVLPAVLMLLPPVSGGPASSGADAPIGAPEDVQPDGEITHDAAAKTVTFAGDQYRMMVDYNGKFQIRELSVNGSANVLDEERGIYTALGKIGGDTASSLELAADPEVTVEGGVATFRFSGTFSDDTVTITCGKAAADVQFQRTFKEDINLFSQSFPVLCFRHNAFENIRWHRSGANFWVDGKASSMLNFLAAGSGYRAQAGEAGFETGNIRRAMEDITFTMLSPAKDNMAVSFFGYVKDRDGRDRAYATEVQRYESGMFKHLEMNMVMSGPSGDLEYLTGTNEGFITEQYTGRVRPQGQLIYRPVNAKAGQTDTAGFVLQPRQYDSFYNLGELKGVDEQRLSEALNNYGRMMILDYDMGTTVENPNVFPEVPALEQHWNTNIIGILRDDGALLSQMNGMRVIRDKLQAPDGHITSPYPSTTADGWGHDYGDMMPGYVLSVTQLYNLTGDKAFMEEMRESIEMAMQAQYDMYYDTEKHVCRNSETGDYELAGPHNEYWEKSRGDYNGYTTAMYYEALQNMALAERQIYGDEAKAAEYETLAAEIKAAYTDIFWSEASDSYLHGTANLDVRYLPTQAAALKTDLVPDELVSRLVQSVERETAVFDLNYHMMNVRDLLKEGTPVSTDPWQGMMGMNGGYYGAPAGDIFAGFPQYGDRTLIARYANGFADLYTSTGGFVGATCYMRDGKTPADYGWNQCMPTMVHPIWGLYTYGYGFQPEIDRLNIAPFIHESMVGSVVNYRWRYADMAVTYESLYRFTLDAEKLPADVYFQFINQTPGKAYTVTVNGSETTVTADDNGVVTVKAGAEGKTTVELVDPDPEAVDGTGENAAYKKPVAASSSFSENESTRNWPDLVTDGSFEGGCWRPDRNDRFAWLRLDLGRQTTVGTVKVFVADDDTYRYTIEGSNDPLFEEWTVLADRSGDGVKAGLSNPIEEQVEGAYHYIRINFGVTASGNLPRVIELEAGKVTPGGLTHFDERNYDENTNIALDKKVSCSSGLEGNWGPQTVVDGKRTSDSASAGFSSANAYSEEEHTEWFAVDLGSTFTINRVILAPRADAGNVGNFFPKDYRIEVSTDGSSWKTVYSQTDAAKPSTWFEVKFDPAEARYVRLTATRLRYEEAEKCARLQLAELEVYPYMG